MKLREEIEQKYKWDLSSYFKNIEEWDKSFNFLKNNYKEILKYENKLKNKDDIYACLELENKISYDMGLLYVYASLLVKEDSTNSVNQNLLNKIEKLSVEIDENTSFISTEIKELNDDFLNELILDNKFNNYDLFFKNIIKNKKHMLSKNEEKLLAATSEFAGQFSNIFDKFDTADVKFKKIKDSIGKEYEMNNSVYHKYLQSNDRTLRENAYKSMNGAYGALNHTLSEIYMGNVKSDCFYAKVRHFNSSLEASLYSEEVDKSVYDTLIKSVNQNLSVFHKYFMIKRNLLKLDKFAVYDVHAPTINCLEQYSYDEAFEIVKRATKCLGDDYVDVLCKAKDERWLDVYANKGKDTGAFSWGFYGKNPVVLLNFENTINDVFTLGHELGHSMHTYYSNKNQPIQKAGYEIFVAEVASTVNEMLLINYFINNSKTKNEKIYYYDYLFKMFYSTIFRQTLFAEFEESVHNFYEKGLDTTTDALNDFYYNLNKKYFGDNVMLVDEVKYEWSRIPHFYSSFYVYKYATGLISAFCIANKISSKDEKTLKGYKKFLTMGATKPPVELLKIAGVDLENEQTFSYVFNKMKDLLDDWKSLI